MKIVEKIIKIINGEEVDGVIMVKEEGIITVGKKTEVGIEEISASELIEILSK